MNTYTVFALLFLRLKLEIRAINAFGDIIEFSTFRDSFTKVFIHQEIKVTIIHEDKEKTAADTRAFTDGSY